MGKPSKKDMIFAVKDRATQAMKDAVTGKPLEDGVKGSISDSLLKTLASDVPKALKKGLTVEEKIEKLKNDKMFMKFATVAGWTDDEIDGYVKGAADDYYRRKEITAAAVKERKIGRNEPCPCGSGKKYKKCCG